MTSYAELELAIRRNGSGSYAVDLRLTAEALKPAVQAAKSTGSTPSTSKVRK
jgi:hypothetical protein